MANRPARTFRLEVFGRRKFLEVFWREYFRWVGEIKNWRAFRVRRRGRGTARGAARGAGPGAAPARQGHRVSSAERWPCSA